MTISLRLDKELTHRLESAAQSLGISKSELLRQCLERYLRDETLQPTAWELGNAVS